MKRKKIQKSPSPTRRIFRTSLDLSKSQLMKDMDEKGNKSDDYSASFISYLPYREQIYRCGNDMAFMSGCLA